LQRLQILKFRGFKVQHRGRIEVKGKGSMDTYYVTGRRPCTKPAFARNPSAHNSLAAVVYGLVQARRRQTTRRSQLCSQFDLFLKCWKKIDI
jgi:adenylate cyclase 8